MFQSSIVLTTSTITLAISHGSPSRRFETGIIISARTLARLLSLSLSLRARARARCQDTMLNGVASASKDVLVLGMFRLRSRE